MLTEYKLPFGKKTISFNPPPGYKIQLIEPKARNAPHNQCDIIRRALNNPINSPNLRELTRHAKKILIITNDNTRPMPSRLTIPAIIESFYYSETSYDITILIATGLHRKMTSEEMDEQFGLKLTSRYNFVNHVATDESKLAYRGMLSTGTELWLNKLLGESDLIISEGFIEQHFFAGYSGGRKSIMPGVAGVKTIMRNHCPANIASERATGANLDGNPIHIECTEAAKMAGLSFILNVALNDKKEITHAWAGHPVDAHLVGCEYVKEAMSVSVHPTDIVITSNNGYPLDRNLYQAVKGIDTAARVVREGGVIIVAAACSDGVGHTYFRDLLQSCSTREQLYQKMDEPTSQLDKWQVQILVKAMRKSTIILVCETLTKDDVERMQLVYAGSMDEAFETALKRVGKDASVSIIPEGPTTIPIIAERDWLSS